jgi:hypothetical protein
MDARLTVTLEQTIIDAVRSLSPGQQRELLEHVNRLREEPTPNRPLKSIKGLWADLGVSIAAEDIDDLRREMWKNFPRSDI